VRIVLLLLSAVKVRTRKGMRRTLALLMRVEVLLALLPVADRQFSATRPGWSKGIGGGDAFMKLCSSSSGCKARLAKGEPAQAGSEPCDGLRNGVGEA
jgi:hypothetical protein